MKINTEEAKKVEEFLKNNFRINHVGDVESIFVLRDGTVVGASAHEDMLYSLLDSDINLSKEIKHDMEYEGPACFVNILGCIRATILSGENYISLPNDGCTTQQYDRLIEIFDEMSEQGLMEVTIACDDGNQAWSSSTINNKFQVYNLNEYIPEDIVKKIKRMYATGILVEDNDMENNDQEYKDEKERIFHMLGEYVYYITSDLYIDEIYDNGLSNFWFADTPSDAERIMTLMLEHEDENWEKYWTDEDLVLLEIPTSSFDIDECDFDEDEGISENDVWEGTGIYYGTVKDFNVRFLNESIERVKREDDDEDIYICNSLTEVCSLFNRLDTEELRVIYDTDSKTYYVANSYEMIHMELAKTLRDDGYIDQETYMDYSSIQKHSVNFLVVKSRDILDTNYYTDDDYTEFSDFGNHVIVSRGDFDIGILQEKIVKKGSKWQVQSEKGRNMGTYDTKKEATKRLGQVEYFKHINEAKNDKQKFIDWANDDELVKEFYKNKQRLRHRDIYYWMEKTPDDLRREIASLGQTNSEKKKEAIDGASLVLENKYWKMYRINTPEASKLLGKDTKWCISGTGVIEAQIPTEAPTEKRAIADIKKRFNVLDIKSISEDSDWDGIWEAKVDIVSGDYYFRNYKENEQCTFYFLISQPTNEECYLDQRLNKIAIKHDGYGRVEVFDSTDEKMDKNSIPHFNIEQLYNIWR